MKEQPGTLQNSPLKFAVVREDADLESMLVERTRAKSVLVVASGGCTALTLAHKYPHLRMTAFDIQDAQIAHAQAKAEAVVRGDLPLLNVADDRADGLNQSGHFEGLFRTLRRFILEFVADHQDIETYFDSKTSPPERTQTLGRWLASPYWAAAFATTFNTPLLHAMFGPGATQHADPGSYPGYFQRVFERGLARENAARNPFLQHVFLGAYQLADAPEYLFARVVPSIEWVHGTLLDVNDLGRFDVVHLSNIFDWVDDTTVGAWAEALSENLRTDSAVIVRKLNNRRSVRALLEPAFVFDDTMSKEMLSRDRSLFYEQIEVAIRT